MVTIVFAIICICAMPFNGFHLVMWKDLFYIFMPAFYVFVIINLDDSDNLDYYIDWIFYTFTLNFLLIAGIGSFTVSNFMSMSFADSYSPWESGLADAYCICFYYYFVRKKWGKCIVSLILNIMSFKRLNLIFTVFVLVFARFLKDKPVPRWVLYLFKAILIISPLFVYLATQEWFALWFESAFGMDLNGFTMGRFNQINFINELEENMTGLGMTHLMLVQYDFDVKRLHCDVIRILIETTIVGLIVFVNNYVNIGRRNQKGFAIVVFFLLVMITSTCIENTYYWMAIYLSLESFQRSGAKKEEKKHEQILCQS